jgi:hypothetical protein
MSSFGKYDGTASIKSATIYFKFVLFVKRNGIITELQQALKNTGFVFEDNNSDHIVISGILLN